MAWLPALPVNIFPFPYNNQHPNAIEAGKRKSTCAIVTFFFIITLYAWYLATSVTDGVVIIPSTYKPAGTNGMLSYADYSKEKCMTGMNCPCTVSSIVMKDILTKPEFSTHGRTGLKIDLPRDELCSTAEALAAACVAEPEYDGGCPDITVPMLNGISKLCKHANNIVLNLVKRFQKERIFLPNLLSDVELDRYMYARGTSLATQAGMTLQVPLDAISGIYEMDQPQLNWHIATGSYGANGQPAGTALDRSGSGMIIVPGQGYVPAPPPNGCGVQGKPPCPVGDKTYYVASVTKPLGQFFEGDDVPGDGIGQCNCAQDWDCRTHINIQFGKEHLKDPANSPTYAALLGYDAVPATDPIWNRPFPTLDTLGNPYGYKKVDYRRNQAGTLIQTYSFELNMYCSMFDTVRALPIEFFTSPFIWSYYGRTGVKGTTYAQHGLRFIKKPPAISNYTSIAEAIEYGFLKKVYGAPTQWGSAMAAADREKYTGLVYTHENFYNQCKPTHCTYTDQRTRGGVEVAFLLAGLAGSLWLYAQMIGPIIYDNVLEDSVSAHEERNAVLEKVLGEPDDTVAVDEMVAGDSYERKRTPL